MGSSSEGARRRVERNVVLPADGFRWVPLQVTAENLGRSTAPESKATAEFLARQGFARAVARPIPVPALAGGAAYTTTVALPSGGFQPDLDFKITVNVGAISGEINVQNNSLLGRCLG